MTFNKKLDQLTKNRTIFRVFFGMVSSSNPKSKVVGDLQGSGNQKVTG